MWDPKTHRHWEKTQNSLIYTFGVAMKVTRAMGLRTQATRPRMGVDQPPYGCVVVRPGFLGVPFRSRFERRPCTGGGHELLHVGHGHSGDPRSPRSPPYGWKPELHRQIRPWEPSHLASSNEVTFSALNFPFPKPPLA